MFTVVSGIVMLGILVFVHELGHFCVAKLAGVKILKFSLGFGPRLISKKWGETEYMICAIPLGGYVQMLGEGMSEEGGDAPLTDEEKARSFGEKPVSKRMAIIAAGPAMNLLLPFLVLPMAFMIGIDLPAYLDRPICLGEVAEQTVASKAGFQAGDCIRQINGTLVDSWDEGNRALVSHAGNHLKIIAERQGDRVELEISAEEDSLEGLRSLGLLPIQDAVVGWVDPAKPAGAAGIMVGDRILSIEGQSLQSWYELKKIIQIKGGVPQDFEIDRAGAILHLAVEPVKDDSYGENYLIGIAPQQEAAFKRFGFVQAVQAGAKRSYELIDLTIVFIKKLFTREVSTKNVGGPLTVIQVAGQAAQTGFANILQMLAFLSINLGILNLLPIPILDGGHIFFGMFELVLRRPLSEKIREIAQQLGLAALVMLMLLAFYNDIVRMFFGG